MHVHKTSFYEISSMQSICYTLMSIICGKPSPTVQSRGDDASKNIVHKGAESTVRLRNTRFSAKERFSN